MGLGCKSLEDVAVASSSSHRNHSGCAESSLEEGAAAAVANMDYSCCLPKHHSLGHHSMDC